MLRMLYAMRQARVQIVVHTQKSHILYTRKNLTTCQQNVFATGLWQACQQVVKMLLFYQVATSLSLTTC